MALSKLLLTGALALTALAQSCAIEPQWSLATAEGVDFKLLKTGLGRPRHLVVDSEGNLLVTESRNGGVRRVVLDDGVGLDVCITSDKLIVEDQGYNHGIALSADGRTLFLSTPGAVFAHAYDAQDGSLGPGRAVLTGLDATSTHSTRTLMIPHAMNPNLLLVAGGSDGNIDPPTVDKDTVRSQVRVFAVDALLGSEAPLNYAEGDVMGWGLRNSVGWAEDPSTGQVWSVENSADNIERNGVDIHNTNPGEELNAHGFPNDTSPAFGANYGYPACFAIYDASVVDDYPGGAAVGKQMAATAGQDLGFTDEACQAKTPPRVTFGSHLAPLDIAFRADGGAALVAFHGSWNRSPGDGYRLSRVDFADGAPVAAADDPGAEVPLLWNRDNTACPAGCFRPCGLALDAGGRLFVTGDSTGELYVVTGV